MDASSRQTLIDYLERRVNEITECAEKQYNRPLGESVYEDILAARAMAVASALVEVVRALEQPIDYGPHDALRKDKKS